MSFTNFTNVVLVSTQCTRVIGIGLTFSLGWADTVNGDTNVIGHVITLLSDYIEGKHVYLFSRKEVISFPSSIRKPMPSDIQSNHSFIHLYYKIQNTY